MKEEIKKIITYMVFAAIGLVLLKYIPMLFLGKDIVFDASAHIAVAILILYILWFFIDQNKDWRIPYFIFCFMILTIISIQRILTNNHNDVGLLLGLVVSLISIGIAEWERIKSKLKF